uniref:uncharacterized protein LOC124067937 n=1 Tax=Scatophagus argus TaxID=75038 RepID=UPI001ED8655C|nr:uncharacterized protein LOC124067937 [Scatophagus argus]XP_046261689.1 uncharacterized protein LOC124067937 [Scatophagus argus]
MILLCITLLLLNQGYALIPVATVQLGESVTFMCSLADTKHSNTRVKWYKQSTGNTLNLIATLMQAAAKPIFERGFPSSRFDANHTVTMSTLTILKTVREDEAIYHCGVTLWNKDQWSGTYLSLKGNIHRTTNYTVVQLPKVTGPVHPGDAVTLQCSVLYDSEKKSCPGEHSVNWFGVRSDKSHANIIYTDGLTECDKKPDTRSPPKSCAYRFSKNVGSSDAGSYYCAVATCGEILFGNGTNLDSEGTSLWSFIVLTHNLILFLLCGVLAISVTITAFLICVIKRNKCDYCGHKAAVSVQQSVAKWNLKRDGEICIYSAAVFTMMKTGKGGTRDANQVDKERIYAAVKALGLN